MKKIFYILFFFSTLFLYAETNLISSFNEIEKEFYYNFAGAWDEEFDRYADGKFRTFSWGKGEEVFNVSILIDYNLWDKDDTWDFQGIYGSKITQFFKIDEKTFKIELKYINSDEELTKTFLFIHKVKNDVIWFETPGQYEYSMGEINKADLPYGQKAYNNGGVLTGPECLYYRRSGPDNSLDSDSK